MGTRTMGSHGGGGGNGGTQQHPKSDGFSKQGALYNLTLDEVQHQLGDLGKPLNSMNLDELLKSVWSAETEGISSGCGGGGGAGPVDHSQHTHLASTSLDLSRDLTKKTVDELWQDIQLGQKKKKMMMMMNKDNSDDDNLGEMTLEDFLAKAGIVNKSCEEKKNVGSEIIGAESIGLSQQQQAQWMQFQIPPIQHQHVFIPSASTSSGMDSVAYSETQMTMSPSPLMATLSDNTQMLGRKRVASGDVMEKTVERRQKRMIKNRESAARSRARKQAYTHELENKVSRLEEENERLKRDKEAEKALPCVPLPEPKYQLRRTSSALF